MSLARRPVVVVGSINMDLVVRTPRIPVAGETIIGSGFNTTPGGKGANQAVAVARLGYPVHMAGMVGNDVFGDSLLINLSRAGVDTEAVDRSVGPSGVALIQVDDAGQNSIVVVPGANGEVDPAFVAEHLHLLSSAGMVLCQLEIPLETISNVVDVCARAGVPVMFDPAPAAPLPESLFHQIAWFTPNETEAALYVGDNLPAEAAAQHLLDSGIQGVVLKRGAEGAYVATAERAEWVPAFPVEAVDTVAAGDCFNGAFAVGLLQGSDPWTAARFAAAAAAISVTRRGAQDSMPTLHEVDDFLSPNVNT